MTREDTEDDDASVITRSRREPGLFAVIFDRHARHIHRYLVRRLGPAAADDVLADTFLIAFAKRAKFDVARPDARPWLYGIATNLVSRQRRAEVRELKLRLAVGPPPAEAGHDEHVADRVSAQALGERLDRALAALRPGERDVLLLVAAEGLGYAEVAEALAIPVGTVKSRLSRARHRVRAELGAFDLVKETSDHG
ncbi:RNA polymerase sigma factor [Amycolatopsis solani]|uniref:RNA polymerase sigma factor n=1 Tax=Amycolatopsis solani TaxID=3028615 RepID=UPI0025AFB535|nr:RNA polymerase sigma factor [Amycolatopsis sp. MEP2-6]